MHSEAVACGDGVARSSSHALLKTPEASAYLYSTYRISTPRTLVKLRCIGGGPAFRRIGRAVVYERDALDRWAQARLSRPMSSTSDTEAA
ncbi:MULTISPECIES: helix-turn-helix domain-containing protein [Methylosinus]|uniref:DNA-binding protein n=1 Tax=Methylosinus trichosporium (strain ATCC 35070 / NCIMB 11131 / UNIQEM 75 / OB3b) TaxID=595536 RepID=A0A2D2D162_METT3|nr:MULTISPECIES: helix-turn-helix domain-containing protein [Methylosinus]ATQ68731.1 DNA-binding protein [Methylosinus trichosporium OB3b]OBS53110.1 hypothetical protein A8B73_07320 [Methylosinus sp. 3S-1]